MPTPPSTTVSKKAADKAATHKATLPSVAEVRMHFSVGTWQKGHDYVRAGAVLRSEVMLDAASLTPEFVVTGEVQGSEREPYDQNILLWQEDDGGWEVDGDCSCPVGHNCKHVVAQLGQVLSGEWFGAEAAPVAPVSAPHAHLDRWLGAVEATVATTLPAHAAALPSAKAVLTPQFLHVIVLDVYTVPGQAGAWLTAWPGQARQLKNKPGELGKVTQPSQQAGGSLGPYDGEGPVFDLLRRWHTGQSQEATWPPGERGIALPQHAVRDEVGAWVLERAAQAGELVTVGPDRLIERFVQWGATQVVSWEWVHEGEAEDGAPLWQLKPRLPSAGASLYLGEPMLYFDREAAVCGRVEGQGVGVQEAQRWLSAPPMPETWMRTQSMRLTRLLPPMPSAVRGEVARDIRGMAPRPCLTISVHSDPTQGVLQAALHFDYDGVQGIWGANEGDVQIIDTPTGKVHLWRDLTAEARAFAHLRESGYGPQDAARCAVWQAVAAAGISAHDRDLAMFESDFAVWRNAGFQIDMDPALRGRLQQAGEFDMGLRGAPANGTAAGALADDEDGNTDWFSLSLGFSVDGQRINLLSWLPELITRWAHWDAGVQAGQPWPEHTWLRQEDGQVWRVPTAPLRPWLSALQELTQERGRGVKADALKLDRYEAMRLATVEDTRGGLAGSLSQRDARGLSDLVAALRRPEGLPTVPPPSGLGAQLRPYQQQGLAWMQRLREHRLGGILADDMGLGKTLQTIAHLLVEKQAGRLNKPALIVAPTSLVGNWRAELQRFAPALSVLVLHGSQRHGAFTRIADHDVVVTTYPLLMRDEEVLVSQPWSILVLDEAQTIKNARTRAAAIAQSLRARQRLCLSGTPMENHLGEIWSLFHFVMPGYLGTDARFKQLFRTPIEKQGSAERMALLRARLAPFMLRRTKAAVASELPPKIETIEYIELSPAQANLYETIRLTTETKVREALNSKGLAGSHITVLDALLKLRQVCCDPRLVPLEAAKKVQDSAKIEWLVDNLPAMIDEGRRVLLFSQFTSMLTLIEEALADSGLKWAKLTGQSQRREAIVERFTSGEVPLFLISLKAGGVGLNLPQADTVIHVDPWWNPAAEDQATDRAHRMGQQSTVFVYKLVAQGTVEERIVAMQGRKAALAQGLHGGAQADAVRLTEGELDWLLEPIGAAARLDPPAGDAS
jgi:superfamily II DNA or RNA helicase